MAHEFLPPRTEDTKNKESNLLQEFAFAPAASWTGADSAVRQESVLHSVLNCPSLCSQLQRETVATDFDPVVKAGGTNRAFMAEFRDVHITAILTLELIAKAGADPAPPSERAHARLSPGKNQACRGARPGRLERLV